MSGRERLGISLPGLLGGGVLLLRSTGEAETFLGSVLSFFILMLTIKNILHFGLQALSDVLHSVHRFSLLLYVVGVLFTQFGSMIS